CRMTSKRDTSLEALARVVDNGGIDGQPVGDTVVTRRYDADDRMYHAHVDAGETGAGAAAPTLELACLALGRVDEGESVTLDAQGHRVCDDCGGVGCGWCDGGRARGFDGQPFVTAAEPIARQGAITDSEANHLAERLAGAARSFAIAVEEADPNTGTSDDVEQTWGELADAARSFSVPARTAPSALQVQRVREGLDAWSSRLLTDRSDSTIEGAVRAMWLYRDVLTDPTPTTNRAARTDDDIQLDLERTLSEARAGTRMAEPPRT